MIRFIQIIGLLFFLLQTETNASIADRKQSNLSSENQLYAYSYFPNISLATACDPRDDDETSDTSSATFTSIINVSHEFAIELPGVTAVTQYIHKPLIPLLIDLPPPACEL